IGRECLMRFALRLLRGLLDLWNQRLLFRRENRLHTLVKLGPRLFQLPASCVAIGVGGGWIVLERCALRSNGRAADGLTVRFVERGFLLIAERESSGDAGKHSLQCEGLAFHREKHLTWRQRRRFGRFGSQNRDSEHSENRQRESWIHDSSWGNVPTDATKTSGVALKTMEMSRA